MRWRVVHWIWQEFVDPVNWSCSYCYYQGHRPEYYCLLRHESKVTGTIFLLSVYAKAAILCPVFCQRSFLSSLQISFTSVFSKKCLLQIFSKNTLKWQLHLIDIIISSSGIKQSSFECIHRALICIVQSEFQLIDSFSFILPINLQRFQQFLLLIIALETKKWIVEQEFNPA